MSPDEETFLNRAIALAEESVQRGGFPAGSVVVSHGQIVGEGVSIGNIIHDPTSHGEIAALRAACAKLQCSELKDAVLYSSMAPCAMCLSAAMWGSIARIVYACPQSKVDPAYYGGNYRSEEPNAAIAQPLTLEQAEAFEEASMRIVRHWEKSLPK